MTFGFALTVQIEYNLPRLSTLLVRHKSQSHPFSNRGLKVISSITLTASEYAEDITCEIEKILPGKSTVSSDICVTELPRQDGTSLRGIQGLKSLHVTNGSGIDDLDRKHLTG